MGVKKEIFPPPEKIKLYARIVCGFAYVCIQEGEENQRNDAYVLYGWSLLLYRVHTESGKTRKSLIFRNSLGKFAKVVEFVAIFISLGKYG